MFDALYIGATGMRGQQMQIDAIAQNVANLRTVGYRRGVVSFQEIAAATAAASGTVDPSAVVDPAQPAPTTPSVMGAGALPTLTLSNVAGDFQQTNDPLNVAIDGVGFFEVTRADGSLAYTRAGQFRVNADGMLTDANGNVLSAHIQVPSDARSLQISANGAVTALVGDRADPVDLGKIELASFANVAGLQTLGSNLYTTTAQSGDAQLVAPGDAGAGLLKQGYLENSNVQMTDELVNLMLAQRAFELNSKVMQAADQMLGITNGLYR